MSTEKKSTLAEQVASAQAEYDSWSPEKKASVRLQGPSAESAEETVILNRVLLSDPAELQMASVLSDLLWAATERDRKNRIREFDLCVENAQKVLKRFSAEDLKSDAAKIWCGRSALFEGTVHTVGAQEFSATVKDMVGETEPHSITLAASQVAPEDRHHIVPGAVFFFTIEEYTGRATITFRRKTWKADEVKAVKESAAELAATFQDTADSDGAILEGLQRKKPRHKDQVTKVASRKAQIAELSRVLVEAVTETEGTMGTVATELSAAASVFGTWWAMQEAEFELTEDRLPDSAVVLSYMGCGASTVVTAGQLRRMMAAIHKAIDAEVGLDMPFTWKERFEHLANLTLFCDYGDNESPGMQIGWGIMQRSKDDQKRIGYGPSVTKAVDASIVEWRQRRGK